MPIISDERQRETQELQLLEQLRYQAAQPNPQRVITWLAHTLGVHATLTSPSGELLASSPGAAQEPPAPTTQTLPDLIAGHLKSAALDEESLKARQLAIGPRPPHAVLTAARSEPYASHETNLVSRTADLLTLALPAAQADDDRRHLAQVAAALRRSVFQLLMGGQVSLARRAAADLDPGALTSDSIRVYVMACGTSDRTPTEQAIQSALEDPALVVRCRAYDEHLIIVAPAHSRHADTDSDQAADAALCGIVAERSDHHLGGSEVHGLAHAANAYQEAVRALIVARTIPQRRWRYTGQAQAASALGPRAARWATHLLQPILDLPYTDREELLTTGRLALQFPTAEAAKILNLHRNTVAGRMRRIAQFVHLDLALQVHARFATIRPDRLQPSPVTLKDMLRVTPTHGWAETFLQPLSQDRRNLRQTLRAWLTHNAGVNDTATELGLHAHTVRSHLRRTQELLQRPLLAGASGAHDLVIALHIVGELPQLPDPAPHAGCQELAFAAGASPGIETLPVGGADTDDASNSSPRTTAQ